MADVIEQTVAKWHQHLRGKLEGGLDELLADDVVFFSPIVFTPQEGKETTKLYLQAAGATLGGDDGDGISGEGADAGTSKTGFRYTKQVLDGDTAVLEFETSLEGKAVNGVDIIRCDDEGKIVEFRVMIRPLQAVNAVHAQMAKAMGFTPPS
jgi:ketosteroid isomerase-like protein